jgi:hypothetical protein
MFYVFLNKYSLPKMSQNLKLNSKLAEIFNTCALKDINLLTHIYKLPRALSYPTYAEALLSIHLQRLLPTLTLSYAQSLG